MTSASASRRETVRQLLRDRSESRHGDRWGRLIVLAALAAAAVLGLLWLSGLFAGTPAEVQAVRNVVDEQIAHLAAVGRNEAPLAYDAGGFGTLMERVRDVPREHRDAVRQEMSRLFEARERAELDSYFATPPDRRMAELDRRIKAEEERRKVREAEWARRQAERTRAAETSGAGPANVGQDRPARDGGPAGGGGTPDRSAGGRPAGAGRRDGTEESRNARSKTRLDATTPERRAMQTEYRRQMDERRRQLGLDPGRRW